jgi:hypothetical protein
MADAKTNNEKQATAGSRGPYRVASATPSASAVRFTERRNGRFNQGSGPGVGMGADPRDRAVYSTQGRIRSGKVRVDTSRYEQTHGRKPRGYGAWALRVAEWNRQEMTFYQTGTLSWKHKLPKEQK